MKQGRAHEREAARADRGGGLSGLALAQGLIKDGHTCEVFERDADDSRKIGYCLHMNADGGEALRRCLPKDTGVHRRTLRAILRARLGDSFHPGKAATGYQETPGKVTVTLVDGTTAEGDVLVGADGIRSAVRTQKLPGTTVIDAGIRDLGVYGRTPLTPELAAQLPRGCSRACSSPPTARARGSSSRSTAPASGRLRQPRKSPRT